MELKDYTNELKDLLVIRHRKRKGSREVKKDVKEQFEILFEEDVMERISRLIENNNQYKWEKNIIWYSYSEEKQNASIFFREVFAKLPKLWRNYYYSFKHDVFLRFKVLNVGERIKLEVITENLLENEE